MVDAKKIVLLVLIVAVVGAPFIFLEKGSTVVPAGGAETLVVMTPHNTALRMEYAIGFKKWYFNKTGKEVNIDWRYQGGGRDAVRYVESNYANNFRLYWTEELGREWNSAVASAFAARSEELLHSTENTLEVEVTKRFFRSDIGCGVDVMFGGGLYEHESQASRGDLVSCGLLEDHPEMFSDDTIPEFFCGNRLWDRHGRWFGASLTAFGIIYNSEAIAEDGISFFPETWTDIGRSEFFKKLAIVDPTKSSSTLKAFVMLIQERMKVCYDSMAKKLGVEKLCAEDEVKAMGDGWLEALRLIQRIVANGRYFTESATRPIVDVSAGNCLAGIAIDFYGSAEAKRLEERSGSKRFKFVMPRGGGAPSPDPIGTFRGAVNGELAKYFVEFILSIHGQKLLDFNPNTPGGPEKTTMRRVPILKTVYSEEYSAYRCDPNVNPYNAAASFVSHDEWTNEIFNYIGQIIKLAFIELNVELSAAMEAILRARSEARHNDADRAYEILSDVDDLNLEDLKTIIIPILSSKNVLKIAELQNKISKKYRLQYILAKQTADGRSPKNCEKEP
jgi:ABC-type Fe3+ transport system substrate-binding protein